MSLFLNSLKHLIYYIRVKIYNYFINIFFQSYQAIGLRLAITALEIQQTNKFERSTSGGDELSNYRKHVQDDLRKSDAFKDISFDHGMYFR